MNRRYWIYFWIICAIVLATLGILWRQNIEFNFAPAIIGFLLITLGMIGFAFSPIGIAVLGVGGGVLGRIAGQPTLASGARQAYRMYFAAIFIAQIACLILAIWPFAGSPGSFWLVLAAFIALGFWAIVFSGSVIAANKLTLWFIIGVIAIGAASTMPGLHPSKAQIRLAQFEIKKHQALDEADTKEIEAIQKQAEKEYLVAAPQTGPSAAEQHWQQAQEKITVIEERMAARSKAATIMGYLPAGPFGAILGFILLFPLFGLVIWLLKSAKQLTIGKAAGILALVIFILAIAYGIAWLKAPKETGQATSNKIAEIQEAWKKGFAGNWKTLDTITCPVEWNENKGWCLTGTYGPGEFRLVPKYDSWKMKAGDGYLDCPPEGININQWKEHESYIREFHVYAPLPGNEKNCSLVARIGPARVIDPLKMEAFSLAGTLPLWVNVNLIRDPSNYAGAKGEIVVEIQQKI